MENPPWIELTYGSYKSHPFEGEKSSSNRSFAPFPFHVHMLECSFIPVDFFPNDGFFQTGENLQDTYVDDVLQARLDTFGIQGNPDWKNKTKIVDWWFQSI